MTRPLLLLLRPGTSAFDEDDDKDESGGRITGLNVVAAAAAAEGIRPWLVVDDSASSPAHVALVVEDGRGIDDDEVAAPRRRPSEPNDESVFRRLINMTMVRRADGGGS